MSLINDALKRAKQAQHKNPPQAAGAPFRPAEQRRPAQASRSVMLPVLIAAILILLLGGGLVFAIFVRGNRSQAVAKSEPVKAVSAPPVAAPKPAPTTPPVTAVTKPANNSFVATPKPAVNPVVSVQSTPVVTPQPTPTVVVAPPTQAVVTAPPPKVTAPSVTSQPPPPLPKLQGIFYHPARPSALLNGKSVFIGGQSGEYTVVGITKEAVLLERAGQTNTLVMPD